MNYFKILIEFLSQDIDSNRVTTCRVISVKDSFDWPYYKIRPLGAELIHLAYKYGLT